MVWMCAQNSETDIFDFRQWKRVERKGNKKAKRAIRGQVRSDAMNDRDRSNAIEWELNKKCVARTHTHKMNEEG